MIRLILSALLFVIFAVLVSMNLSITTSFRLPGVSFEKVSVVAIASLGFASGILFSLSIHFSGYLRRKTKQRQEVRGKELSAREGLVSAREARAEQELE